ncbi:hypothetical protein [Leptolyngbya sp. BL0902]|uniref:hypothetical protein n=1 Tax=Leptolyngbya sp. BL0902 TaxID=1115757 RepID=UPI0018E8383F|nr:hypothetical protein [Leptolyngbya sp. BL0902]
MKTDLVLEHYAKGVLSKLISKEEWVVFSNFIGIGYIGFSRMDIFVICIGLVSSWRMASLWRQPRFGVMHPVHDL